MAKNFLARKTTSVYSVVSNNVVIGHLLVKSKPLQLKETKKETNEPYFQVDLLLNERHLAEQGSMWILKKRDR